MRCSANLRKGLARLLQDASGVFDVSVRSRPEPTFALTKGGDPNEAEALQSRTGSDGPHGHPVLDVRARGWVKSSWTVVIVTFLISTTVLGLEFIAERHASWRMNWREFFTDTGYMIFSATAIAWVTATIADDPLKSIKTSLGITTHWAEHMPFLAQVALVVFLVEFGQYWMHRLMHNWTPFWLVHAPHHHLTQLNAMKGAVGNPSNCSLSA